MKPDSAAKTLLNCIAHCDWPIWLLLTDYIPDAHHCVALTQLPKKCGSCQLVIRVIITSYGQSIFLFYIFFDFYAVCPIILFTLWLNNTVE